ncbi:MAG TPA: EamA family transporter [Xanthobacteraceae bacterium]|nr:EamA family transporter [Xanthobacteraceae bacterium]
MEVSVIAAVLAGAAMHAGWNSLVKIGLDRFSMILLLSLAQGLQSLVLLWFFPMPAMAAWPWLAASAFLHTGYKLFLIRAYAHGDLSQIYPLARGSAPLMVAIFSAPVLGEKLSLTGTLAVVAIGLGVALMSLKGGGALGRLPAKALFYAAGTAVCTAAYTIVDGIGARASGTASGFTFWMFVLDTFLMVTFALATRGGGAIRRLAPEWRTGLAAGGLSLGGYWIAIWAFTVAPIALVAALRETSVLFVMLIAVVLLGERAGAWRWLAAALIVGGIGLVRL